MRKVSGFEIHLEDEMKRTWEQIKEKQESRNSLKFQVWVAESILVPIIKVGNTGGDPGSACVRVVEMNSEGTA